MYTFLVISRHWATQQVSLNSLPHVDAGNHGTFVHTALSIVIGVVGAIAFLMVVIGGFRYVLSQGDPQGVAKAKGTIIYALVGLILAIIAQSIVSLVVTRVGK